MKLLLLSDFNLQNFAGYLKNSGPDARLIPELAPFGQVVQILLDSSSSYWLPRPEASVVWTRPESVLPSFKALLDGHKLDQRSFFEEIDHFAALLKGAAERTPIVLVPSWTLPPHHLGHGLSDLGSAEGPLRSLLVANLRLIEAVQNTSGIYPLAACKWMSLAGSGADNPRLWYGAKIPFGNEVFKHAARDVAAALRGIRGRSRKLVVVDLDDTLWGGVVGDVGWNSLQLGGHDPLGEAFQDFQRTLKGLSRRGVALGIVSKNTEAIALEAIRSHPEMQLAIEDFAGWRINWNDKAQNLAELARDLNLGLDSVVFLDDNPAERARVREAFPEILVPDLPEDKRLYTQTLLALDCFDKPAVTAEDRTRSEMYAKERMRTEARRTAGSLDEWLATINLVVSVSPLGKSNLPRVAQLLNKTNQLNLSTRRMTEAELWEWYSKTDRYALAIKVADRFGDYGITGMMGLEKSGHRATIVDFVLSCRVMGRRVEETMLRVAVEKATRAGARFLEACYLPTAKNAPCLEFLRRSGLQEAPTNVFAWNLGIPYPADPNIRIDEANFGELNGNSIRPRTVNPQ
jgi:FkbH-like protein